MGEIEIEYDSTGGRVALRAWDIWAEMWVSGRARGVEAWGRISGAGCELEIIMLCPAEPSSVLRGRLGRGGMIWGRVVYIMSGCGVWGWEHKVGG